MSVLAIALCRALTFPKIYSEKKELENEAWLLNRASVCERMALFEPHCMMHALIIVNKFKILLLIWDARGEVNYAVMKQTKP